MNNLNTKIFDNIISSISFNNQDNVIITGGHYKIISSKWGVNEKINNGTIKSFELAVKMYLKLKKKNINAELGLLINDMDFSCDSENCNYKLEFSREKYDIPQIYKNILANLVPRTVSVNSDKRDILKIFWEKNVRNRSKKEFLKILKKSVDNNEIIKKNSTGYFIEDRNLYGDLPPKN